jgi:hypothetical protein
MRLEWEKFLQETSGLVQARCFAPGIDFLAVKRKIVEGMSMPADDALLYRYSFGQGGYVDLAPGMELRIERNIPAEKAGSSLRTITTSYGFSSTSGNNTQINFLRSLEGSKPTIAGTSTFPDATLATTFHATPHLRLILQRLTVAADTNSPAILLGGADMAALDEATHEAVDDPKLLCEGLRKYAVTCVDFNGLVTVSPVLNVKVNGHLTYVPLGSKVVYVFSLTPDRSSSEPAKTLKIRREFDNHYRDLQFHHDEQDYSQILLFGGDEISWSKSHHR